MVSNSHNTMRVDLKKTRERMKELREKKKLTQEDIAKLLNVERSTYSSYENGRLSIKYDHLIDLAKYYGVSIDYLLGKDDKGLSEQDMKLICNYIGLSEDAITALHSYKLIEEVLNYEMSDNTNSSDIDKSDKEETKPFYPNLSFFLSAYSKEFPYDVKILEDILEAYFYSSKKIREIESQLPDKTEVLEEDKKQFEHYDKETHGLMREYFTEFKLRRRVARAYSEYFLDGDFHCLQEIEKDLKRMASKIHNIFSSIELDALCARIIDAEENYRKHQLTEGLKIKKAKAMMDLFEILGYLSRKDLSYISDNEMGPFWNV